MLEIKSDLKDYSINFPTSLLELTPEVLASVVAGIKVPQYHAIIALAYSMPLFQIAIDIRNKKEGAASVIPIMASGDINDLTKVNCQVGDRIVTDRSSLERGTHINVPIMIGSKNASNYISGDNKLISALINGDETKDYLDKPVWNEMIKRKKESIIMLDFKIIPLVDIKASMAINHRVIDPFRIMSKELAN